MLFLVSVPVYAVPSSGCFLPVLPFQLAGVALWGALHELSGSLSELKLSFLDRILWNLGELYDLVVHV